MTDVVIYRFTGRQGFFKVPAKWCKECDLLVDQTKKTIAELGLENRIRLKILPWWLWFWKPLISHFAWHAPILVINDKLASQGVLLEKGKLIEALRRSVSKTTDSGCN